MVLVHVMPQLKIDQNLSIYYRDDNPSGSLTVVLLHGLGVSGNSWILQIPALVEAGFRVITPDMQGFGKSEYTDGQLNVPILSRDVRHLITTLQVSPVYLVGISMGGAVALQTILDEPEIIHQAVLINTFAYLRPESVRSWVYFISRFFAITFLGIPTQARLVSRNLFPHPSQESLRDGFYTELLLANPRAYHKMIWALFQFDVRKNLSEIQIPILIISGEKDTTVPVNLQNKLHRGLQNSKQIFIADAGHGATVEKPDQVNCHLLDFFQS